jgi:hypothetical protein
VIAIPVRPAISFAGEPTRLERLLAVDTRNPDGTILKAGGAGNIYYSSP